MGKRACIIRENHWIGKSFAHTMTFDVWKDDVVIISYYICGYLSLQANGIMIEYIPFNHHSCGLILEPRFLSMICTLAYPCRVVHFRSNK